MRIKRLPEGVFHKAAAFARIRPHLLRAAIPQESFGNAPPPTMRIPPQTGGSRAAPTKANRARPLRTRRVNASPTERVAAVLWGAHIPAPSAGVGFASARRGGAFSSGRFREARRRPGGRPDRAGGSRARRRRPPRPRRPPPEAGIRSPGTSSPCPGGRCCARRTARASPPPAAS